MGVLQVDSTPARRSEKSAYHGDDEVGVMILMRTAFQSTRQSSLERLDAILSQIE